MKGYESGENWRFFKAAAHRQWQDSGTAGGTSWGEPPYCQPLGNRSDHAGSHPAHRAGALVRCYGGRTAGRGAKRGYSIGKGGKSNGKENGGKNCRLHGKGEADVDPTPESAALFGYSTAGTFGAFAVHGMGKPFMERCGGFWAGSG